MATKSEGVGLVVRVISFQDFQPMWSQSTNVTDGQTDGRTDGRHAIPRPRICTKVHCAVIKWAIRKNTQLLSLNSKSFKDYWVVHMQSSMSFKVNSRSRRRFCHVSLQDCNPNRVTEADTEFVHTHALLPTLYRILLRWPGARLQQSSQHKSSCQSHLHTEAVPGLFNVSANMTCLPNAAWLDRVYQETLIAPANSYDGLHAALTRRSCIQWLRLEQNLAIVYLRSFFHLQGTRWQFTRPRSGRRRYVYIWWALMDEGYFADSLK